LSGTGASMFDGESDIEIMAKVFGIVGTEGIKEWSGYSGLAADQKSKLPGKGGVSRLRHKFPSRKLSSAGFEVLSGLLESNPEKRLTAAEALKKPWFGKQRRGFAGFFKSCVGGVTRRSGLPQRRRSRSLGSANNDVALLVSSSRAWLESYRRHRIYCTCFVF
uniref:Protein kinase domain-containing protein n=1 Tax=Aegilops tauschii subsp. strangulata TaxID=200361 RepID=A0A453S1C2_AEGTS